MPDKTDIVRIIESHIRTIDYYTTTVELAFFGGNFTGIPIEEQIALLSLIKPYIKNGFVKHIRISTRPDYINTFKLELLKKYDVKTIELGVQSLDDEVLKKSGRGYTSKDVYDACTLIKSYGFELGLQMMIGLPGDCLEKSCYTAQKIIAYGATLTRIYPLLVIKDTLLEDMYREGIYTPLTLAEAVDWGAAIFKIFNHNSVNVIKMGLHPAEELRNGDSVVAGPFHQSFAELVYTSLWKEKLEVLNSPLKNLATIYVHPLDYNHAIGYKAENKKLLLKSFKKVKFLSDNTLKRFQFYVNYS